MGRWKLDEWIFGKEVLDRWDTKRNGQEFSSEFLTLVERNKMNYSKEKTLKKIGEREDFSKWNSELKKYSYGHIFKLNEIPEVFKAEITKQCGGLERDRLAKKMYIQLYCLKKESLKSVRLSSFLSGCPYNGLVVEHLNEGGLEYVENEKCESALRVHMRTWTNEHLIKI